VLLENDSSQLREMNASWKGSFLSVQPQEHEVLCLQVGIETVGHLRDGQRLQCPTAIHLLIVSPT